MLVLNWALIRATVQRYLTHALLVVVIVGSIGLSEFRVPGFQLSLPARLAPGEDVSPRTHGNAALARGGPLGEAASDSLVRISNPHTTVPDRPRRDIITYTVQPGDSLEWQMTDTPNGRAATVRKI